MNYINEISGAVTKIANTAKLTAFLNPEKIEKFMFFPKGKKFTATEMLTLKTVLQAVAWHSTESSRGYPIGDFIGVEDKSSETTINTTPYGSVQKGQDGKFHWLFAYEDGGVNYQKMLRTFEGKHDKFDVLLFDKANNAVMGTTPDDNTSGYVLQGFALDLIYNQMWKVSTGTDKAKYGIGICLSDTAEFMDNIAYYTLPKTQKIMTVVGLSNLEMSIHTNLTAGVVKVRFTTDGGAINLYDTYGAALVALVANFSATNDSLGTTLTVAAAVAAATKTVNFTLTTTPTVGHVITLNTPTVAQLTATVPGYAENSITFTSL